MKNESFKKTKKYTVVLIILATISVSFSPIFATKAEAQWIDISTAAKDYGLDAIAWMMVNTIISRMTASTVNWINSGFKGSPAFVTNPDAFYGNAADQVAGQFIFQNPDLNFLCSPLQARIRLALTNSYTNQPNFQCTMTKALSDVTSFMNNFENGGWNNFFQVTQNQQNNPIGAYFMAQDQLSVQLGKKNTNLNNQLNQGRGFLSYQTCKPGTEGTPPTDPNGLQPCDIAYNQCVKNNQGNEAEIQSCGRAEKQCFANNPNQTAPAGDCTDANKVTNTPGSVIAGSLDKTLGLGSDKLVTADEINEIVSALLNQIVSQVMGGIGGLLGGSQPSSAGAPSLTDQLAASSTTTPLTDYFGNTQDLNSGPQVSTSTTNNTSTTTTAVRPADKDCALYNDSTLISIAQNLQSLSNEFGGAIPANLMLQNTSLGMYPNESIDQIIANMDCTPPGIH